MMNGSGIFVFGTKIFYEERIAKIFSLPLEISWRIFSYLDDSSLQTLYHAHKIWARIIASNRKLRKKLYNFQLAIRVGSSALAKFYKKERRKLKKVKRKNYLEVGNVTVLSTKKHALSTKREGEEFIVYSKRFKLS